MQEAKAPSLVGFESLSLPLILEYRLNIISVNAPLRSEENYLSSPQMCWKQQQEPLRAAERRNVNAPEQTWLEHSWGLNRAQCKERGAGWKRDTTVALQNPVSQFCGIPLEARWHLGRDFLFKDPNTLLHAHRLTEKLEAVWCRLGILLWFREGFLYPGPWSLVGRITGVF